MSATATIEKRVRYIPAVENLARVQFSAEYVKKARGGLCPRIDRRGRTAKQL